MMSLRQHASSDSVSSFEIALWAVDGPGCRHELLVTYPHECSGLEGFQSVEHIEHQWFKRLQLLQPQSATRFITSWVWRE